MILTNDTKDILHQEKYKITIKERYGYTKKYNSKKHDDHTKLSVIPKLGLVTLLYIFSRSSHDDMKRLPKNCPFG